MEFLEPAGSPAKSDDDIVERFARPIIVRIDVMDYAFSSGRWPVVGNLPVEGDRGPEVFFKQDAISGDLSLYSEDASTGEVFSRRASFEEVEGLERAAVWDPDHVEDRLRDHIAGVPNKWVESLRPHPPGSDTTGVGPQQAASRPPPSRWSST